MSFLLKILFAAIVFVVIGSGTLLMIRDVNIPPETITKTIPQKQYLDD